MPKPMWSKPITDTQREVILALVLNDPAYRGNRLADTVLGYDARLLEAEAALAELVACKELKEWLDNEEAKLLCEIDVTTYRAKHAEYKERKPRAWAEARRVLGKTP